MAMMCRASARRNAAGSEEVLALLPTATKAPHGASGRKLGGSNSIKKRSVIRLPLQHWHTRRNVCTAQDVELLFGWLPLQGLKGPAGASPNAPSNWPVPFSQGQGSRREFAACTPGLRRGRCGRCLRKVFRNMKMSAQVRSSDSTLCIR